MHSHHPGNYVVQSGDLERIIAIGNKSFFPVNDNYLSLEMFTIAEVNGHSPTPSISLTFLYNDNHILLTYFYFVVLYTAIVILNKDLRFLEAQYGHIPVPKSFILFAVKRVLFLWRCGFMLMFLEQENTVCFFQKF